MQLHSIAHGVVSLDQAPREYGAERRRLRIVKMRGIKFRGGYHDFVLETGGIQAFPRLIAAEHHASFDPRGTSTGSAELDLLLGGGLVPGTNTLLLGPSGVGKTTTAIRCMLAALERGETATYYLFDEGLGDHAGPGRDARYGSGPAHRGRAADRHAGRSRRALLQGSSPRRSGLRWRSVARPSWESTA